MKLKRRHGKVFRPKVECVKWNAAQEVCFVSEASHRDVRKGRNGEYVHKGTIGVCFYETYMGSLLRSTGTSVTSRRTRSTSLPYDGMILQVVQAAPHTVVPHINRKCNTVIKINDESVSNERIDPPKWHLFNAPSLHSMNS